MRKSIFDMPFSSVYQALISKAERKGRNVEDVLQVTTWLTGYKEEEIKNLRKAELTYGDFFRQAPKMNDKRDQIKGKICGINIETIEDPLMQEIRRLDKLVDDLAKGKSIEKILNRN